MPYAVAHILFPILLVAIFRDFYLKKRDKKSFPLHYVFIAGLGGVLPDIDIIISIFLNLAGIENWNIHKTFTHSLFFSVSLIILFLVLKPLNVKARICNIGKHNLKLSVIFLMLAIGSIIHILLDALVGHQAYFLYPFSSANYGINLISLLPASLQDLFLPTIDGILVVLYIAYLQFRHKISDFI